MIILLIENHAHFDMGGFTKNQNFLLLFIKLSVNDISPDDCNLEQDVNLPVMHWERGEAILFSLCSQSSYFVIDTSPIRMAYLDLGPLA